ncbi:hypothetical protein SO694_00102094 [Aureococcus anophagefferens]|uniref:LSO1/LSO2 domain-containing protein n=1 Tax=Aureococcus anophagefferens TaxID=44056 RepID=A0ABR1FNA4_AURAN
MPAKHVNTKVEAANAKKAKAQAEKDAVKAAANERAEAANWAVGSNSRGAAKAMKDAEKDAAKADKDAARWRAGAPRRRRDRGRQEAQEADKVAASKGIVMDGDKDLMRSNDNRKSADDGAGASGMDNALSMLGVADKVAESKNVKVLTTPFVEKTMPVLKEENPGLKPPSSRTASSRSGRRAPRTRRTRPLT